VKSGTGVAAARDALMSRYRRLKVEGGAIFYTLALARRAPLTFARLLKPLTAPFASGAIAIGGGTEL
jgi:hypothetical protein